jgi:hypothetical protein
LWSSTRINTWTVIVFAVYKLYAQLFKKAILPKIKKKNFMIIGSKQKKICKIQIGNMEQTQYIKYLGTYIDKHITWEQQIKHLKAIISKNTGIINKLRYHTLIYLSINYGLMSWASTYTSHLIKLQTALNKCIRSIFFAHKREDATPYYSLLGILK